MAATDKKTVTQDAPQKKRERRPINGHKSILEVRGKEPGFHYAWIPEPEVYLRQENGFEHVRHAVTVGTKRIDVSASPTSHVTVKLGAGLIGYLMRIPQEWYDEDMAQSQEHVNEQERARIRESSSDGLQGSIRVRT